MSEVLGAFLVEKYTDGSDAIEVDLASEIGSLGETL